jgi:hypothetical protein
VAEELEEVDEGAEQPLLRQHQLHPVTPRSVRRSARPTQRPVRYGDGGLG